MKIKVAISLLLLTALIGMFFYQPTNVNADDKERLVVSKVLESFETNDRNWDGEGSKYTKKGFPQVKPMVNSWPQALFGRVGDEENKYCFGARTSYFRMGYNSLKVKPEEPIEIPGLIKSFFIWIWGANYSYDVELQITDFKGISYKLPVGRLNYLGWKVHQVEVPPSVPQLQKTLPRIKHLKFDNFTIWSLPGSNLEGFNVYFDHFTVLTDVANETYDGDDLSTEADTIWSGEESDEGEN